MPKNTNTARARDTASFKDKGNVQVYHNQATTNCSKCSENHGTFNCSNFNSLSIENKVQFVKKNKLVFNCWRTGHSSKDCKSKSGCRICKKRHNTLFHRHLSSKKRRSVTPVLFGSWGIHFMFSHSITHSRRPSEDSQVQSSVGACFIGRWLIGNLFYCQMQGSFGITTKAS